MSPLEYQGLAQLKGPLAFVAGVPGAGYHDAVEVLGDDGASRRGRILAVTGDSAVLEVFGETQGLDLSHTRVRLAGEPMRLGVGPELLGRVFDGTGRPRDGLPPPVARELRALEGAPINPVRRVYPRAFLETGVSAIDAMNAVVLGQKIPLFTQAGLPHDELAMQLLRQARAAEESEGFAVVLAGLGMSRATARRYQEDLRQSGALGRTVAFLNLADDPAAERLIAPRCALTAAEYLAFDEGRHVLVVLGDITAYGEALREIAAARGEVPSRKGYPGYLYSDLASLFERAGRIRDRPGSVTQLPIVTMPSGDITHPIPDLTGYVTEGQIVLGRDLERRGIYPPIEVLPSLSRLMDDGIGEGRTRTDHPALARQLYAACARTARARGLASIIGRDELSVDEARWITFGEAFETRLVQQGHHERRTLDQTLDIAWSLLDTLPDSALTRIPEALLKAHQQGRVVATVVSPQGTSP